MDWMDALDALENPSNGYVATPLDSVDGLDALDDFGLREIHEDPLEKTVSPLPNYADRTGYCLPYTKW